MDFKYDFEKVLNSLERGAWVEAREFIPEKKEVLHKRGVVFLVISFRSKRDDFNKVSELGEEIVEKLYSEYYLDLSGNSYQALVDSVSRVSHEFTTSQDVVEIGMASVINDVVNLTCFGSVESEIEREGAIVKLTDDARVVRSVSGKLKQGDVLKMSVGNNKVSIKIGSKNVQYASDIAPSETAFNNNLTIRQKLVGMIDEILTRLPDKRIQVTPDKVEASRRIKTAPFVGVSLLAILVISIYFGVSKRRENDIRSTYESKLSQAKHQFEEAISLSGINKSRSRELVLSASTEINDLIESGIDDSEVNELKREIDSRIGEIAGIYKNDSELYLDLSLISNHFRGDLVEKAGERLLVLDKDNKSLVEIQISNKKTDVLSDSEFIENAQDVVGYESRSFILSTDGVREVTNDTELIIKSDWDSNQILIASFAGNMYVLEKQENMIWRYPGVRLGFSEKQEWIGSGINTEFDDALSWSIDGMIWVLYEDNSVSKYSRGIPQKFSLEFPDNKLIEFKQIFTSEDEKDLYLLDSANGRVMVFSKEGEFKGEYVASDFRDTTQFVVSELDRKLIYLKDGKLFELELSHI